MVPPGDIVPVKLRIEYESVLTINIHEDLAHKKALSEKEGRPNGRPTIQCHFDQLNLQLFRPRAQSRQILGAETRAQVLANATDLKQAIRG